MFPPMRTVYCIKFKTSSKIKKRKAKLILLSLDTSGYGRIVDTLGPIPQITRMLQIEYG